MASAHNIILDLVHNDAVEVVEQINGTFSASNRGVSFSLALSGPVTS
jgi:hypothetical protein